MECMIKKVPDKITNISFRIITIEEDENIESHKNYFLSLGVLDGSISNITTCWIIFRILCT